jgi:DNA-binding XRE family transcriptional regulator
MSALTAEVQIGTEAPCALYRFFAADGTLLYVGISDYMRKRFRGHSKRSAWWSEAAQGTVALYPSRPAALAAESEAILTEQPVHNVQGRKARKPKRIKQARAERVAKPTVKPCAVRPSHRAPKGSGDPADDDCMQWRSRANGQPRFQNGGTIHTLRKLYGYSQMALAKEAGISQGHLARVETEASDASPETVAKISKALRITSDVIMRDFAEERAA